TAPPQGSIVRLSQQNIQLRHCTLKDLLSVCAEHSEAAATEPLLTYCPFFAAEHSATPLNPQGPIPRFRNKRFS
ncbi:hypothetical protein AVEN_89680-1, partial [Araneus ventricosus]